MRKLLIGIIAVLIVAVGGVIIYSLVSDKEVTESEYVQEVQGTAQNNQAAENEEEGTENTDQPSDDANGSESSKVYTPTFMYFISNSDENFDETNEIINELKKEYDGKVNFDIVNIDENPEAKDNFPVEGQTPALIMLNTSNDISAFNFKCDDKETLKNAIEAAMK